MNTVDFQYFEPSLPTKTGSVTLDLARPRRVSLCLENGILSTSTSERIPDEMKLVHGCKVSTGKVANSVVIRKRSSSLKFTCETESEQRSWISTLKRCSKWALEDFYDVGEKIVSDTSVLKARNRRTGMRVAIKPIKRTSTREGHEVHMMEMCHNQSIMRGFEYLESMTHSYIVMPRMKEDLQRYVCRRQTVDKYTAKRIMFQVLQALVYLHEREIAHRNIKLDNVFTTSADNEIYVALGDFGLSKTNASKEELAKDVYDCGQLLDALAGKNFGNSIARAMMKRSWNRRISAYDAMCHRWFQNM